MKPSGIDRTRPAFERPLATAQLGFPIGLERGRTPTRKALRASADTTTDAPGTYARQYRPAPSGARR